MVGNRMFRTRTGGRPGGFAACTESERTVPPRVPPCPLLACLLACLDMAEHVRDFGVLRDLHRVVEARTETLFATTRGCLFEGRQHRERRLSPGEPGANEGDACLTVRCTGHGASRQQHPQYNSPHPRLFARHHTTGRSTPRSHLASEQMETSGDPVSASLGMEKNFCVSRACNKLLCPCPPSSSTFHQCF